MQETEARINFLREKSRKKYDGREASVDESKKPEKLEHVNFFADLEDGKVDYSKPNAEHEAEKKAEQEKYEKQIGYLTYLGQDTNEATGKTNWYDELPMRLRDEEPKVEVQISKKLSDDPMKDIRGYLKLLGSSSTSSVKDKPMSTRLKDEKKPEKRKRDSDDSGDERPKSSKRRRKEKKRSKRHGSSKSNGTSRIDSKDEAKLDVEKLRAERLLREQSEKLRAEALLAKLRGDPPPVAVPKESPRHTIKQKYNSQFCPEIARQNAERTPRGRGRDSR